MSDIRIGISGLGDALLQMDVQLPQPCAAGAYEVAPVNLQGIQF